MKRPIEEAPRDGTQILAFRFNGCGWEAQVVWWSKGAEYPWSSELSGYPEDRFDLWEPIKWPREPRSTWGGAA